MPIQFNTIPISIEVPGQYVEIDNSRAQQGLAQDPHRILVMGQKLAAGSAAADVLVQVTSLAQARDYFGQGSMLAGEFEKLFAARRDIVTWALPVADDGAGVQAAGTLTFTGPATAAGTSYLWIAGRPIRVAVLNADTATAIATTAAAAINAEKDLAVTASSAVGVVTVTARHKGAEGNSIDLRGNYADGEKLPAGVGLAVVAMASGATNPVLTTALANLGDNWFQTIVFPWLDSTSLSAIEAKLLDRWGGTKMIEGIAYAVKRETHANLLTFGGARNSAFAVAMGGKNLLTPPWEHAAVLAVQCAYEAMQDPARPLQQVSLPGVLPPATADRFTKDERELLLKSGVATFVVDPSGNCLIERAITTYQKDSQNNPDKSYHDSETIRTLMRLRYTSRTKIAQLYPRYKLASDSTPVSSGQVIVRPKDIRQTLISIFDLWQQEGLVENKNQFITDLVVERSASDVNRVDAVIPPDVINQLRVFAAQVQFRL